MKFREAVDSPCGLRYMFDTLELSSGVARRAVLESVMMTSAAEIEASQVKLADFYGTFPTVASALRLQAKLAGLKDISGTLSRLASGVVLDDVALFEIKELCLLSQDTAAILSQAGDAEGAGITSVSIPGLSEPLDILDPEGQRVPSFHVYDSYSPKLKDLRDKLKKNPTESEILVLESLRLEDEVRRELSEKLKEYASELTAALESLTETDILLAKAMQMRTYGLVIPRISIGGQTKYSGIFHPQIKDVLALKGKEFQPVHIAFGGRPVTIIGANMGGKTVVLKMVALAQYLFQFGFGVPASAAEIDIKECVRLCIGEEQSPEGGLSSFGAEVVRIDEAITSARAGVHGLSLFDEPARTTNPVEGTALVSAFIDVMNGGNTDLLITTHYNLTDSASLRLRVKGLQDGKMNYELVEAATAEVPHEAIAIARSLDADAEWLELTKLKMGNGVISYEL